MRGFKFPMLEGFRRLGLGVIFDFTARRASEGIEFEGWGGKEWQPLMIARRSQQCLFAQNGESRCAFCAYAEYGSLSACSMEDHC